MSEDLKEKVGAELASRVNDGDILGVGTGTTVEAALRAIDARMKKESLSVHVVPTSYQSAWACQRIGLQVLYPGYRGMLSWGFDGADEVDEGLRLIKGKGGALFSEKLVASRCEEFVVIVGEDKLVSKLGEQCAVPVEVHPDALATVEAELEELGASELVLRKAEALGKTTPYFTQFGNLIIDVSFPEISDVLEIELNAIPGVIENGIFTDHASEVLVASTKGVLSLTA